MPVLAHIHQLFNAEQCQAYTSIHCGGARESHGVPVLLTKAVSVCVSWPQQTNLPGYLNFFRFLRNFWAQNVFE